MDEKKREENEVGEIESLCLTQPKRLILSASLSKRRRKIKMTPAIKELFYECLDKPAVQMCLEQQWRSMNE